MAHNSTDLEQSVKANAAVKQRHTAAARALHTFIQDYFYNHGYAPSYQEMAGGIGQPSKSRIAILLDILAAQGYLIREHGKIRCFTLTNPHANIPTAELLTELRRRDFNLQEWQY